MCVRVCVYLSLSLYLSLYICTIFVVVIIVVVVAVILLCICCARWPPSAPQHKNIKNLCSSVLSRVSVYNLFKYDKRSVRIKRKIHIDRTLNSLQTQKSDTDTQFLCLCDLCPLIDIAIETNSKTKTKIQTTTTINQRQRHFQGIAQSPVGALSYRHSARFNLKKGFNNKEPRKWTFKR